jgi:hypothetical protein
MRPWSTAFVRHFRGMTRRFPIKPGNVCSLQPPGGCCIILWEFIYAWLQDSGPSCCISPRRIATSCNSLGNRIGHVMASHIHEHPNGHAECRLGTLCLIIPARDLIARHTASGGELLGSKIAPYLLASTATAKLNGNSLAARVRAVRR